MNQGFSDRPRDDWYRGVLRDESMLKQTGRRLEEWAVRMF